MGRGPLPEQGNRRGHANLSWLWGIFAGIGGLLILCILAAWSWRKKIAKEFAAYIAEKRPDISILRITASRIHFRSPDTERGQLDLHKIISACSAIDANDPKGRRAVYEHFFNSVLADDAIAAFSYAEHAASILPQLIPAAHLPEFIKHGGVLHRPLDGLPLCILYVADAEQKMQYLNEEALTELGISPDALHELALSNLRKIFPEQSVRAVIERNTMILVAAHDCYDAARILLLPEYLREGEKMIALIPDRDTLGLAPVPESGDMSALQKLANTPFNRDKLLLKKPVLATRNGFALQ